MIKSPRDLPLLLSSAPSDVPVLTVEAYEKWYELFLVHPDGRIEPLGFDELEPYADERAPYVDHVPNPWAADALAEDKGWHLDVLAFEVMVGRWVLQVELRVR